MLPFLRNLFVETSITCSLNSFYIQQVKVNGVEYQPSTGASTKKAAKMQAAAVCLQNLGMIPRDHQIS